MAQPPSATFSRSQVGEHGSAESAWVIIDSTVYEVTDFLDAHPGGRAALLQVAGSDATTSFYNLHRHDVLAKYARLAIGTIEGEEPQVETPRPGDLSTVPYAEPCWLSPPFRSPYYGQSHHRLQRAMRSFVDVYLTPEARECESSGRFISQTIIDHMSRLGILHMRLGPGPHLKGVDLLDGTLAGDDFDPFHDLIVAQELARPMTRGFSDGNMAGMTIGLTAVLHFARDPAWKQKIADEVLSGRKKLCLAVSEASAGSDVAGLQTKAEKTADGKHYVRRPPHPLFPFPLADQPRRQIVNGSKKWITNGMWCDYFVTAVRTGDAISVLLIERGDGLETEAIKTSYSAAAGTSFVTFDNVKVPVANLLGEENKGIQIILSNFNHERWTICCEFHPPLVINSTLPSSFLLTILPLVFFFFPNFRRHSSSLQNRRRRVPQVGQPACHLRQASH